MKIRFVALSTDHVQRCEMAHLDANDMAAERHLSPGEAPCRHCLADIGPGEPMLIAALRPFPSPQPYAEVGPVFLHAEPARAAAATGRHSGVSRQPQLHRARLRPPRPHRLRHRRSIVETPAIPTAASAMFEDGASPTSMCARRQQLLPLPDRAGVSKGGPTAGGTHTANAPP